MMGGVLPKTALFAESAKAVVTVGVTADTVKVSVEVALE